MHLAPRLHGEVTDQSLSWRTTEVCPVTLEDAPFTEIQPFGKINHVQTD